MTEAARIFWGSILRHLLTMLFTGLIAHGYVSQAGAMSYVEELVGVLLNLAVIEWGQRAHYWALVKYIIARALPHAATSNQVQALAVEMKAAGTLPEVYSSADVIPTLAQKEK